MGRIESLIDGGYSAGSGVSWSCSLCLGCDHIKEDCALSPLELAKQGVVPQVQRPHLSWQAHRPVPYVQPMGSRVCYMYNKNTCFAAQCRFEHFCSKCRRIGHPATSCPEPTRSGEREAKSPPPQWPPSGRNRKTAQGQLT